MTLKGSGKERFLNLCSNQRILIWNLKRKKDEFEFCTSRKAYQMMQAYKEKTNVNLAVKGEYGLPFFFYRYRKRKGFILGFFLCALLIFVSSRYIWEIKIDGTENYTKEQMTEYLKTQGIREGIRKKYVFCDELEEKIRADFSEASWVSCDIEGTCLTVRVKESLTEPDAIKIPNEACDVIADRDGIISSIVTRNGTPMVRKNDAVKKGDILISGTIELYNEFDELLETNKISADGDIYAQTVYHYEDSFPLHYYEKIYTGNETEIYRLKTGKYEILLPHGKIQYEQFDETTSEKTLRLGRTFYLPFVLLTTQRKEYDTKQVNLSETEAREKARKKIETYKESLLEQGFELISEDFDVSVTGDMCELKGTVTVIQSIGKFRIIS